MQSVVLKLVRTYIKPPFYCAARYNKIIFPSVHLLLWMNFMLDLIFMSLPRCEKREGNENIFLQRGSIPRSARPYTEILKCALNSYTIIPYEQKTTRGCTCAKLIVVRGVLKLTYRKNMRFFYQCRFDQLLHVYSKLCTNTANQNQFDTYIVTRLFNHGMRWSVKHFNGFLKTFHSGGRAV